VNLRDDVPPERRAALSEKMKKMFFTSTGLKLARKTLLGKSA
jgi:hypothetical protein